MLSSDTNGRPKMFQSYHSSIKTFIRSSAMLFQSCFNPTIVRLKPEQDAAQLEAKASFNPTIVRLKPSRILNDGSNDTSFNPTIVRLKL